MEKQTQLSLSSKQVRIEINEYQHYANSVGNNLQSIQITTKYRYQMMKQEKLKVFCITQKISHLKE